MYMKIVLKKRKIETNNYQDKLTVYSAQEAIDGMLILPEIDVITCNKVIRKSLYKDILYPVGNFMRICLLIIR